MAEAVPILNGSVILAAVPGIDARGGGRAGRDEASSGRDSGDISCESRADDSRVGGGGASWGAVSTGSEWLILRVLR
jgi:hypothetical protein